MSDNKIKTETVIQVTRANLPLACPTEEGTLRTLHPKVYLPIEKTGREVCPYCGNVYLLED